MKLAGIPSLDSAVPIWAVPAIWRCKCGHGPRPHLEVEAKLYCAICRGPCSSQTERIEPSLPGGPR